MQTILPHPSASSCCLANAFQSIRKVLKHINNSSGSSSLFLHHIMKDRHARMRHHLAGASGGCDRWKSAVWQQLQQPLVISIQSVSHVTQRSIQPSFNRDERTSFSCARFPNLVFTVSAENAPQRRWLRWCGGEVGGFFDSSLFKPRQLPPAPTLSKKRCHRRRAEQHRSVHFACERAEPLKERLHGNAT